ncbi:MAG: class I SAM-dependent methyltransferase [Candidatus Woesearchaeota archaeon]|jgi:SAM-dependent methyltransferase
MTKKRVYDSFKTKATHEKSPNTLRDESQSDLKFDDLEIIKNYSELVNYYNDIALGYDELHFEEQKEKFSIIKKELESLGINSKSIVLDVGCGTFFSFNYFNWNLFGVEPSSKMVDLFKKSQIIKNKEIESKKSMIKINKLNKLNVNKINEKEVFARIIVGFADCLSKYYSNEYFDSIICVSVAHHFKNSKRAFVEMKKVCKKDAVLGISLLKGTRNFNDVELCLCSSFKILNRIDSSKDVIFICKNID